MEIKRILGILPITAALLIGCGQTPASIKLDPKNFELSKKGETKNITAAVLNAKGQPIEKAAVEWSSSDAKVATVAGGKVTAVSSGTATITVKIGDVNEQAFANVHIPTKLLLEPAQLALRGAGVTQDLTASVIDDKGKDIAGPKIEWSSDNPAVAKVSDRTVTAVADGTAKITARSGDASATVTVLVKGPQPTTMAVDPSPVVVKAGTTQQLNVVVNDDQGQTMTNPVVSWSSADPGVATVSERGLVSGVRKGDTAVTASAGSAMSTVPVKVR